MSRRGYVCQTWLSNVGNIDIENLPDRSLEDAANYCRSPDSDSGGPWCFVDDYLDDKNLYSDWDYCDVPKCTGDELIIHISIDSKNKRVYLLLFSYLQHPF